MKETRKQHAEPVVRLDSVSRLYGAPKHRVTALDDVSIGLEQGTFTAVMGPSGSGKTTLLHCAAVGRLPGHVVLFQGFVSSSARAL
ncbi:ATP-binding cassette domain-containing protein [Streptomyces sp. NPDC091271]|uniref:ATP-binding cassette domain-containing protein n=1 Tax=Streptomyces sp. NPDC091271 TaxID=3365980 RepID=UPI00380459FE